MIENEIKTESIQGKPFIDEFHEVSCEYDNLLHAYPPLQQFKKRLRNLIKKDSYYFDSYLTLADILIEENQLGEARKLIKEGFDNAIKRLTCNKGRWPRILEWGYMENRHIIRILDRWGMDLWDDGNTEEALDHFRNLFKSNPSDNIGVRFNILAIRMGLDSKYERKFASTIPGFLDARKVFQWFEQNSKKFPDEFQWWWDKIKKEEKEIK